VPEWMTGLYEVSPIVVGVLVASAIAGSLGYLLWTAIAGRRR
jgi:hypothetical protein